MWARTWRGWSVWCWALLGLALASVANARQAEIGDTAPAVTLSDQVDKVDAWPALRVLFDASEALTLEDVRARDAAFVAPVVPRANFGLRGEVLWLRLNVQTRDGDGRWILQLDYPALNQIDVYQVTAGQVVLHRALGSTLLFDDRPLPTSSHAVALDVPPGPPQVLYLRVRTTSSMIVPVFLLKPGALVAAESQVQWLQGLLTGLTLAFLLYSVAHGLARRDVVFIDYALVPLGLGFLFLSYTGLGQQHFWHDTSAGWAAKIAPLSVLVMAFGASRFVRGVLQAARHNRRLHRLLGVVAGVTACTALACVAGLLNYRQTQVLATVLGPLPMLMGMPEAWRQARGGDRVARFMLGGWVAYTVGALSMVALLRGWLPLTFWTRHAFQFAFLAELLLWMRVLSLRTAQLVQEAERARTEQQVLRSMAYTDALTGLPNRRGLVQAITAGIAECLPHQVVAVYLLDLDGFKPINDRLGHDVGDQVLVQVAQRLKGRVRRSDIVARLGGDEFVVMAMGLAGEADALQLGQAMLAVFNAPIEVAGHRCQVGLTIGFALAPHDGVDAGDLLKRADAAMYAGKQAGRHCVRRGTASEGLRGRVSGA